MDAVPIATQGAHQRQGLLSRLDPQPDRPEDLFQRRGYLEVRKGLLDQRQELGLPGQRRELVVPGSSQELHGPLAQVGLGRGLPAAWHVLQHSVGIEQHMPDRRCVKPHMRLLIIHATMITGHHSQRPSHYRNTDFGSERAPDPPVLAPYCTSWDVPRDRAERRLWRGASLRMVFVGNPLRGLVRAEECRHERDQVRSRVSGNRARIDPSILLKPPSWPRMPRSQQARY